MKIIHYIPSIDRTAGGTSTYMQVLAKGLGGLAEVHIITHASENPLVMENCKVHYVPEYNPFKGAWRKRIAEMMEEVKPDIVHVNCCWLPACAAVQRIAYSAEAWIQGGADSSWNVGALDCKASLLDAEGAGSAALPKGCSEEGGLHPVYGGE